MFNIALSNDSFESSGISFVNNFFALISFRGNLSKIPGSFTFSFKESFEAKSKSEMVIFCFYIISFSSEIFIFYSYIISFSSLYKLSYFIESS